MKYQGITIFKRQNCNSWYARYRANGKQFCVSAKTQKDCYNKLKTAVRQRTKGQILALQEQKQENCITFIEWYKKWFNLYKNNNVKQTTIMDYNASIKYLQNINNIPLNSITDMKINEELNKIPFERRKQKVYELLNDIFTKAVKNHIITNNPITSEKPKHKKISGISLTIQDQNALVKTKNEKYIVFLFALYQGMRKGEFLALTENDIDLKNNTITINKSLNILNKIDETKNIYSNRVIPIFNETKIILKKILTNNPTKRIFDYKYKQIDKIFKELKQEYNFNKKYTIHSLRHTFITNCQEANIPLHIIQQWVGHNIGSKVTNQVYTHARTEINEKYIKLLNKKLNSN